MGTGKNRKFMIFVALLIWWITCETTY